MTSYDASTRADLHLVATVVGELTPRAEARGLDLLVVGAAARDILLSTRPARATNDVDIAVTVRSYGQLGGITEGLDPVIGHHHKFLVRGIEVDIVAFGEVEAADRTVTSPEGTRMNALGLAEAMRSAVTVALPFGVEARVVSLPAQVALKLVAWSDRHLVTTKDAVDLLGLLTEYASPGYVDSMYDDHFARLERYDYDLTLAAAERIGAEAGAVLGPSATFVVDLVARECSDAGVLPVQMGPAVAKNVDLLTALLAGLRNP